MAKEPVQANDINKKKAYSDSVILNLYHAFTQALTWEKFTKVTKELILGAWLIALYAFCSYMVVYSLSAHQLNYAINTSSASGELEVGSIRQIFPRWLAAKNEAEREQARLVEVSESIDLILRKKLRIVVAENDNLEETLNDVSVQQKSPATAGAVASQKPDKNEILKELDNQLFVLRQQQNALSSTLKAAQTKMFTTPNANGEGTQALSNEVIDYFNTLAYFEASTTNFINTEGLLSFLPNVGNFLDMSVLTEMPPDMLTLILVLSMGALGGTIHLTQVYFREKNNSHSRDDYIGPWFYIFRPALGCVTAISVYILAKAGILVVSAPNADGTSGSLSPYFVAFLGIISGLVAETALTTIKDTGLKWFSSANTVGRDRWAFGLGKKLDELGKKLEAENSELSDGKGRESLEERLSGVLEVREATIKHWAEEAIPVPHEYQTLVAAFVQSNVRDVFSDLSKSQMSVESES